MSKKRKTNKSSGPEIEIFHDGEMGICPKCGRKIALPCLACRIESIPKKSKKSRSDSKNDPDYLDLKLNTIGQRKRYVEVRKYRDRFEKSMFAEDEVDPKR